MREKKKKQARKGGGGGKGISSQQHHLIIINIYRCSEHTKRGIGKGREGGKKGK